MLRCLLIWLLCVAAVWGQSYERVDRHALAAPPAVEKDVHSLVAYLVRICRNDEERSRVIFRWITDRISYDAASYAGGRYPDGAPVTTLQRRTAVCDGFSRLYAAMASEAHLDSQIVLGACKGYGFEAGSPSANLQEHAWNAVRVGGRWRLLDSTWGSGALTPEGTFVKRFNDYFFLTPPERMLCDHFPRDARWQLVSPRWSRAQFDAQVRLSAFFFLHDMRLESHRFALIESARPFRVTLRGPRQVEVSSYLCRGSEQLEGAVMVSKKGDSFRIDVAPPGPGAYTLRIFAGAIGELTDHRKLDQVVEYHVRATGRATDRFPRIYGAFVVHEATLESPLAGELRAGKSELFSIRVPGARAVRVQLGQGQSVELSQRGELFSGKVPLLPGKATVFANFGTETSYNGILEYLVR